jgi:hypothetical protein
VSLLWEYGSATGAPSTLWADISDAVVLGDAIIAVDRGLRVARRITIDGELESEFGGPGEGPGEFNDPVSVQAAARGIRVYDRVLARSPEFTPDGVHLATRRTSLPPFVRQFLWVTETGEGWSVGATPLISGPSRPHMSTLVVAWQDPLAPTVLAEFSGRAVTAFINGWDVPRPTPIVLGPDGGAALLSDTTLAVVDGGAPRMSVYRFLAGRVDVVATVDLPGASEPVTAADRDRLWMRVEERWGAYGKLERAAFPAQWPAWSRVEPGGDGDVWVLRAGSDVFFQEEPREEWLRVDPHGPATSTLRLPARVEALAFAGDLLVARRRGPFDVQYLALYRILDG